MLIPDQSFIEKNTSKKKIERKKIISKKQNVENWNIEKKLCLAQKDQIRVRMKTNDQDKGESEKAEGWGSV